MFGSDFSKVMSPDCGAPTPSATHTQAPQYLTGTTDKVKYRKAVTAWHSLLDNLPIYDNKSKADLFAVGYMLYLACD